MKKFTKPFLLLAALLLTTNISFGQVGLGVRAGLNMADLVGVNTNAKFKAGLHIGGYAKFKMGAGSAFQAELLYSMKGYHFSNSGYSEKQSLGYLDIPLLFNFGQDQGMHFQVGLQPSILLSAKYKYTITGGSSTTTDTKSAYKGFDLAPVLGFGYQMDNGLDFGMRFAYGMIPVFAAAGANKIHNVNLQLTVGYTLAGK